MATVAQTTLTVGNVKGKPCTELPAADPILEQVESSSGFGGGFWVIRGMDWARPGVIWGQEGVLVAVMYTEIQFPFSWTNQPLENPYIYDY